MVRPARRERVRRAQRVRPMARRGPASARVRPARIRRHRRQLRAARPPQPPTPAKISKPG
jgi:hypothetical protein